MTIIQAVVLGAVQGLTELLPISSSAHLFIIPFLLNWQIPESFDVALHAGTLLAIVLFFYKDWLQLIKGAYEQVIQKRKSLNGTMFFYIVAATIPGGIIGFILDKFFEEFLTNPILIAVMLIIMGVVLYVVDKNSRGNVSYEKITFKQSFLIGLFQSLAFIPGVSRSGITMTVGRALGLSREAAAKYSFMLSAPIVLAATVYKFKEFAFDIPFLIGVLISFVVGVFVINFLLDYLKNKSFKIFAIYRIIAGLLVILWVI